MELVCIAKLEKHYKRKKWPLLIAAAFLIVGGAWFTTTNLYKFIKGYYLYRTEPKYELNVAQEDAAVTTEVNEKENVGDEKKLLYSERPSIGDEIGELYIPKLGATLPIIHGTDEDELARGVGHFAGSVLPGENDNCVLAGHRDTVFRRLGEVGEGDTLIVRTDAGEFEYIVSKVRIVEKDDRTVIVSKPRAMLTVSTCYPFDFIGSAPERYVLVAYLAEERLT